MKNIHVLPTDKPSRLLYFGTSKELTLQVNPATFRVFERSTQNIYITNDEEIKVGDWFISLYSNSIQKELKLDCTLNKDAYKKIILTTDQSLDGVQAIDDEFLKWFVKNPSCEEVVVIYEPKNFFDVKKGWEYKIIIPKEEPKQVELLGGLEKGKRYVVIGKPKQETLEKIASEQFQKDFNNEVGNVLVQQLEKQKTLEEAAERNHNEQKLNTYTPYSFSDAFKDGANWQAERMYSEEEVIQLVSDWTDYRMSEDIKSKVKFKKWFEQFKNKGYEKHTHNTNR